MDQRLQAALSSASTPDQLHHVFEKMQDIVDECAMKALLKEDLKTAPLSPIIRLHFLDSLLRTESSSYVGFREQFLLFAISFFEQADAEPFAHAPSKVLKIVRLLDTKPFLSLPIITSLIFPLRRCIQKVFPTNILTPLHYLFVHLCVAFDAYSPAKVIISNPMFDFDPSLLVTAQEFLSYFYFSGLIFAALKQFSEALHCFNLVTGAASVKISAQQIAAHKKSILIGIILHGPNAQPLPSYASQIIIQNIDSICTPYSGFIASARDGPPQFESLLVEHNAKLVDDQNLGLAKQALKSLISFDMLRQTEGYLSLSISDISVNSTSDSVKNTENVLRCMIDQGLLSATIDQSNSILTLCDDQKSFDDHDSIASLFEDMQRIFRYHERIIRKNTELANDRRYLQKTLPEASQVIEPVMNNARRSPKLENTPGFHG